MMWRREPLEWDEPKEKVIMAKLKGIPGWKSDEEEECPSLMSCAKQKSRAKKSCNCTFCNNP